MKRRHFLLSGLAAGMAFGPAAAQAARAVCYNCPPEWADWGGMLRLLQSQISLTVPPDNKNSGQSLAALIAERARPVADVVYLGGQVGPQAREVDRRVAHHRAQRQVHGPRQPALSERVRVL